MIARFNRPVLIFLVATFALGAIPAFAQLSVPGKVMTYRTIDTDSGDELVRIRVREATDGQTAEVSETTYPTGTRVISECAYGNGFGKAATSFRSVMHTANGELERSDFDTFDPTYYPFLAQPVTAEMQPGTCVSKRGLDLPTLMRGGKLTTWIWSDSGLVGAIFHSEGEEKLTVPAGTFDAVRIRIDTDLSKVFPRVPELFLKLIKPHFTIWLARAEPYYVLRMEGFGSNVGSKHKNTAVELASMGKLTPSDTRMPAELAQVEASGADPHLTTVNAGRFSQGDRTGRVTLATASMPDGELLVTHVAFGNGLATESRTLIDPHASPVTSYLDDRSFSASGAIVRKHVLFFRKAAFPDDPDKDLPTDLYGGDTTLGLVMPRLLPEGADEATFHVMDFYGQVNQLTMSKEGTTGVALASEDAPAIHAKLKPIIDVPLLLRPLAYFFIPSFDAYFDTDPSHRLLKFEGPLGPPGVPTATMIADQKAPASRTSGH